VCCEPVQYVTAVVNLFSMWQLLWTCSVCDNCCEPVQYVTTVVNLFSMWQLLWTCSVCDNCCEPVQYVTTVVNLFSMWQLLWTCSVCDSCCEPVQYVTAVTQTVLLAHISLNYLEITNKMRPCVRIYYSNVSNCSTCFERHIAHHQELKNCICSLWFTYTWWPDHSDLTTAGHHMCM
jgi:hypothetical protein